MGRLAAEGAPVFCDDVLPIRDAARTEGMSLGMAPRLRLPLPETAGAQFRAFVARHGTLTDASYTYLKLPDDIAPTFGKTAPIGAVVLLERVQTASAELSSAQAGDGLQQLIRQNLTSTLAPAETVARMHRLIEELPCFRLVYSDLDEAVALLVESFSHWGRIADRSGPPAQIRARTASNPRRGPMREAGPRYRRGAGIAVHGTADGMFLVDAAGVTVYRLNAVAAGMWRLLEAPTGLREAVDILHGAFPDTPPERIAADVQALLEDFLGRGLVVPAESRNAPHRPAAEA